VELENFDKKVIEEAWRKVMQEKIEVI